MVSCCAHVIGLRWRKMLILIGGFDPQNSFSGMTGNSLFCFLLFFYENFFFPSFETLNGTRRLPLGESREIPFSLFVVEVLTLSARISLRQSKSSSFAFFPQTEEDLAGKQSFLLPTFPATGILWFDWSINLSPFKMKG